MWVYIIKGEDTNIIPKVKTDINKKKKNTVLKRGESLKF